jgi:hypothetical protein
MKIGLLIYDDDPKTNFAEKVRRAAARYQQKYGQAPTACYVNPAMVAAGAGALPDIEIVTERAILPNHLWLGLGEPVVARAAAPQPAGGETAAKKPARRKAA